MFVGTAILAGVFFLLLKSHVVELLSRGDHEAQQEGFNPAHERRMIHLGVSLIVGVIISFCGFIGFVGLLVPQIARRILGSNQRILIPVSTLCGALILVSFDLLSRVVHLPMGILTALIGTPIFGFLAYAAHRKNIPSTP